MTHFLRNIIAEKNRTIIWDALNVIMQFMVSPRKSLFDSRFRYQYFIRNTSLSCNTSLLLENLWLGILILFMDVDKVIPFPTMLLNGIMIVMLMCQYSSLSFFLEPLIVEGEMVLAHLVVFESFSINDTFFFREFQHMVSAPNDNSLSSNQDTNQFLVQAEIELQISYTTMRDFTS